MMPSSPRKRGPMITGLWNMGPRFRGDDPEESAGASFLERQPDVLFSQRGLGVL